MEAHKIFISGPMTGYEKYNFPAFDAWEYKLRKIGHYEVVNPANIARRYKVKTVLENKAKMKEMIQAELYALADCDTILLLNGWEKSRGAKDELRLALKYGMNIVVQPNAMKDFELAKRYRQNG